VALAGPSEAPVKEKRQDNGRAVAIGVAFLLLASALVAIAPYPAEDGAREAANLTPRPDSSSLVSGTITLKTADKHCRKTTFDLQTGRVTEVNEIDRPCTSEDSGPTKRTINSRIDAIGRSFVNR
jgi:hypothetical protein